MAEQANIEERGSGREPVFTLAPVVAAFIAVCFAIHLLRVYLLSEAADFTLILHTAFIPLRYSMEYVTDIYAVISPVTYSFLHGDMLHLGINMIWLAAFGSPLAHRIGGWRFVGFWLFTVIGAAGGHFIVHPLEAVPVIGASGAVSGMMAAAARFGFSVDRSSPRPAFTGRRLGIREMAGQRSTSVFLGVWFIVNLIAGLGLLTPANSASIAWEAHIGGFVAGLFGIMLFDRQPAMRA